RSATAYAPSAAPRVRGTAVAVSARHGRGPRVVAAPTGESGAPVHRAARHVRRPRDRDHLLVLRPAPGGAGAHHARRRELGFRAAPGPPPRRAGGPGRSPGGRRRAPAARGAGRSGRRRAVLEGADGTGATATRARRLGRAG